MMSRSTAPTSPPLPAAERRAQRLLKVVRAAGLWLLLQGALLCLLGPWLSDRVDLRYMPLMVPYIRMAGLAYACLGLYLLGAARSPRYQYLVVDLLILFMLGQSYFTLGYKLDGGTLNHWEWLSLALNLAVGTLLTAFRTRSPEMDPQAGTLWSLTARQWAAALMDRRPSPAKPTGASDPAAGPAPAPGEFGQGKAREPDPRADKPRSERLPHMD